MTSLYEQTKFHPLLNTEPPFSKFDSKYKGLFDEMEVIGKSEPVEEIQNSEHVFVVYEMPVFLQPITYQKYLFLISQNQTKWSSS